MYAIPDWPTKAPEWTKEALSLLLEGPLSQPPTPTLAEFLNKSEGFPIKFPIDTVRCKALKESVPAEVLQENINSAYPLIHENALFLYAQFLLHKRQFGSAGEKQLYKRMTILDFVHRLLTKRAAMFMGRFDHYILVDGTKGSGKWNLVGKGAGHSSLPLEKCLSYDEIKVSVFLSVSSYSYFINNGTRKNFGLVAKDRKNVEDEGVVIGVIGARLKKAGAMEYEEMVISKTQNTEDNGYGSSSNNSIHAVFASFYEEPCFTYKNVLDQKKEERQRFTDVGKETFFDNVVFAKRIALSIDTLLLEANHRAKVKKALGYIHVVGIGLGVWMYSPHQETVFVETFAERLRVLGRNLSSISDVYFSYFNRTQSCGGCKHGDTMQVEGHPKGFKIYFGKRNPHERLSGADKGKLLIVSYAWDGNALPGNEFWGGKLGSSGDSAAAASTQISEVHNPHINPKVCAGNLQVATPSGVLSFEQYRGKFKHGSKRLREDIEEHTD